MSTKINLSRKTISDTKTRIREARRNLGEVRQNKAKLKNLNLERASVLPIQNRNNDSNEILKQQKIESMIKFCKTINYHMKKRIITLFKHLIYQKTVPSIGMTSKTNPNLKSKIIDGIELMSKYFAERNSQHLNQDQGFPFTIESLIFLIGNKRFTSFAEEILNGSAEI